MLGPHRLSAACSLAVLSAIAVGSTGCAPSPAGPEYRSYGKLEQPTTDEVDTPVEAEVAADDVDQTPASSVADRPNDAVESVIPASALAPLNLVDGRSPSEILKVDTNTASRPESGDSNATRMSAEGSTAAGNPATNPPPILATPLPGGIRLLVPDRQFKVEGPNQAWRVSYDDLDLLKVLNMEPVTADAVQHFPEWLSQLNGKTIRIRGFMYPTFESSGIEQFVLARDNQICCFGRDPKVYDLIAVTLKPGVVTDYIPNRPFDVVGTFRIDLLAEQGKPLGLYWLENARVVDR